MKLEEVTPEEVMQLSLLGEISFGLVVQTESSGVIFENLILNHGKCYYVSQEESFVEEWGNANSPLREKLNLILIANSQMCPPSWTRILQIYHIVE